MKCTNCGNEVTGKFCTNCGTPAPVETPQPVQNTEPLQYTPAPEQSTEAPQSEPAPVQTPKPMTYNYGQQTAPEGSQQTSFGQQFTNAPSAYSGQQFTNQPNSAPQVKKGMSGGKIAAIIIASILALVILLGVIFGTVACGIIKASQSLIESGMSAYNDNSSIADEFSYIFNNIISDESSSVIDSDNEYPVDDTSNCVYYESDEGIIITGYDDTDFYNAKKDIVIPSEINGKKVVEIEEFYVFDYTDSDNSYIKVTVPSTVKVIREYAMSFCDINEIVIENGVETIEEFAFCGSDDLEKATIPESVTSMDGCSLGFECDDETYIEERMDRDDFVMYGKKGSTAEQYANENNLRFIAQ